MHAAGFDKVLHAWQQLHAWPLTMVCDVGPQWRMVPGYIHHQPFICTGLAPHAVADVVRRVAAKAITECAYKLVQGLHALGPEHAFNIDDLLLRESMDIIGPYT